MKDSGKIKVLIFLFSVFFLGSCIPGKLLMFESLSPSEFSIPPEVRKVLVFNSSYVPSIDTSSFNILAKLKDTEEQYIVDTLIINNILNGFFYIADQSPVSSLQNSKYLEQRSTDTTAFLRPLSNESIAFLMREFEADMVISLEYYGMNFDVKNDYIDFGTPRASLMLDRALLWRIYDRTGLLKEKNMRDTIFWIEYGETIAEAENNLPRLIDAIREAFWFAGEEFARDLSPSWMQNERSYYILMDEGIDRSLDPLYLMEIIQDSKGIKSYKAMFNLAIYHEKEGNPSVALEYMDEALKMRPGAVLAKYYRKELLKKVSDYEKLEKQLQY